MSRTGAFGDWVLTDPTGRQLPLREVCWIGRDEDCAVRLDHPEVSRRHAEVRRDNGQVVLTDLRSANGTWCNERRLGAGESVALQPGDRIRVGNCELSCESARLALPLPSADRRLVIGRDPSCDVALDDPQLSRRHAALGWHGGRLLIEDLGSANGTYVGGQRVVTRGVEPGQQILLGRLPFVIGLAPTAPTGNVLLEARNLWRCCPTPQGWRMLLRGASTRLRAGRLVAVVGPSGAGKSTMLNALIGFSALDAGTLIYRQVDVTADPTLLHAGLGYVPQDNAIHLDLTVGQVYDYAARLRLPPDHGLAERTRRIQATLTQLGLDGQVNTPVKRLSGGERKRANLGVELLTDPDIVALDEPTSGLDPLMERRLTELLGSLAGEGRLVLVITHAIPIMEAADELIYLAPGGRLVFQGSPAAARRELGLERLEQLFEPAVAARLSDAPEPPAPITVGPPPHATRQPRRLSPLRQAFLLGDRYLRCLLGDGKNLALIALQAPFVGLLIAALFSGPVFSATAADFRNETVAAGDPLQVAFALTLAALWIGVMNAAREVVKERAILARERLAGVEVAPYLVSKWVVLVGISGLQMLAMVALIAPAVGLGIEQIPGLTWTLTLLASASAALGLLLSTLVKTTDQAMSVSVMVMLQQLLFAGVLLPLERMDTGLRAIAELSLARWGLGAVCARLDLPVYLTEVGLGSSVLQVMETDGGRAQLVLVGFCLMLLLAAWAASGRRPRDERG